MESYQNKGVTEPNQNSVSQNDTQNLPTPPPPPQVYHNFVSSPAFTLNPADSYFYPPWLGNQIWRPIHFDFPYNPRFFYHYPMAAQVGQNSLLASANTIQRTSSAENNMNLMNTFNKSLQPISKVIEESRENGKRPSVPETNKKGLTRSAASTSMGTTIEGHDVNNVVGFTKFSSKLQGFPLTKHQQSSMMHGNADHFETNPTELNQNLGADTNASVTNPQFEKEESDEQRKRQAKGKLSERSRKNMKLQDLPSTKQQQSSMMPGNGGGAQNVASTENCNSAHDNRNIASDHFEANPTKLNQNLSTYLNASGTNPQLEKENSDEIKDRKRQAKNKSARRSRIEIKIERKKLIDSMDNIDAENAALKKKLLDLSDECGKLTEENNSLLEELVEKYGRETIMNFMNAQSSDSVAAGDGDGQN